ncbi:BgTH12-02048 [Blumeria graminis f. sp. triticale]|uniref:BgTH12-02048 n=1 Tax=Blumeria graminis f. sp. triticale TaxID=1689686 RepID=A0A9W4GDR4_BLUGR|nr:BgTH12-02048 [Blumeria graminis f. sp. triticale]
MSLVSQPPFTNSFNSSTEAGIQRSSLDTTEATLTSLLAAFADSSDSLMDRATVTEYSSQQDSHPSFSHALSDPHSEESAAVHASTSHFSPRLKSHSASPPEYTTYPTSARSTSFPDHIHRQQNHPSSNHSGSSGGMPQSTSPSLPMQDGRSNHHHTQIKPDQETPIDPSIAASSPTYPHPGQYSPYHPQQDLPQGFPPHPSGSMYTQPRPDWAGYAGHQNHTQHTMPGSYSVTGPQTPSAPVTTGARPGQVYSFVPIPGAQQHKRPRRRYEEIERMYKCGWNGCEKAYGTLNHLNAHVTMQSHAWVDRNFGNLSVTKHTLTCSSSEFKEIRKEWKARKKEEENLRKAEEDRNRIVAPNDAHTNGAAQSAYPTNGRSVQLPPIGYQPTAQVANQYQTSSSAGIQQIQQDFSHAQLAYSGYPASPYGAPSQMYSLHH